jgi:UPF0755 protein
MSRRSFRIALVVVGVTLLVGAGIVAFFYHQVRSYPDRAARSQGVEVEVEIAPGTGFAQIATLLAERDVIDKPRWFRLYAMHRGVANRVRSGRYVLRTDWTPRQVLDRLLEGVPERQIAVTLPEGRHMLELFDLLGGWRDGEHHPDLQVAPREELERLARDPEFLRAHGIEAETVEGYLYPDTYRFVVPTPAPRVLERLIAQHRAVWNQLVAAHPRAYQRLRDRMKWSDRDILTMASIVEKEAVQAAEQPRIAQVFLNRLTFPNFKPRRLETDPTIRYGCQVPRHKSAGCQNWAVTDRLRRAQLDDKDNPYNTYQHEGLPPGPICNPGVGAMRAVLEPDGSNYLYFVAKDDRSHAFSRTLAEHERNVDKYIRGKP